MYKVAALLATMSAFVSDRFADRKDRGATAVEYGLLVGLIAVVIILAVVFLGETLLGIFTDVGNTLDENVNPAPTT